MGCPAPATPTAASSDLEIPALRAVKPVPHPEDIRFGHPPPVAGAKWTVAIDAESESPDPGGGGNQRTTYQSRYRVEILAVDGPATSRMRLTFERNVHSYQGAPKPTVLEGKSYVLDARAPNVRDANDQAVTEDETQRVLDAFPDLGTRGRIDEVLPDDAMHIGDHRDELAAAILRLIHPRAWTLEKGSASLAIVEPDRGVFNVSIDAVSESGLEMRLTGEAQVRRGDARLMHLVLGGPYTLPGKTPNDPIIPQGSFTLRRHVTSD